MTTEQPSVIRAEDEVVGLCRDLIRIDSTNFGDNTGPGERAAAEYVMGSLDEVGISSDLYESAPGRSTVIARIEGADPGRPAMLLHGHLDVVPAFKDDWSVDPFGAEVQDDMIWGRGAVDMKDMDAMMLANIRELARQGTKPPRDLVIAFFADEEAGGRYGSHWMVDNHPEVFEGVTEAVSEVGGFSVEIAGQRCYLLQTAEKGIAWLRMAAGGVTGHGSQINQDNAVTRLAAAVARIGTHQWPIEITPTVRAFLDGVTELTGVEFDPDDPRAVLEQLGPVARWVGATLQNTANPTMLDAGYKQNVIPGHATAHLDCRFLPGRDDDLMATLKDLAGGGIEFEFVNHDVALEVPFEGDLKDAMVAALLAEDPGARVLPYCMAGGTDNKALSELGITGYGFAPLRLPADLDFSGLFHGIDERVPVDSLLFGTSVLRRFLATM